MHYHVLNSSIVLNYLGKTVVIAEGDKRYKDVLDCIRNGELDSIPSIVETERAFEGTGIELRDGLLYENDNPIPNELNARIMKYKELGLPYDSLLKFWDNIKQNPSYNSRQMLFRFLEANGHPLTEDGCFIAYRGVREDFKDKHTGTIDNSVGAKPSMPREMVDDNPNNTCSRGYHVACYDYAKNFGAQLVEVKVNPKDVVCVPTDYNGTKMRVCGYEVVAVGDGILTETVYGTPDPTHEEGAENEEVDDNVCPECEADKDSFHNFCPECGYSFY